MGIEKSDFREKNDPGETFLDDVSGLILLHITTRKELYEAEFANISEATQYYLSSQSKLSRFELTYKVLFEVHKRMFNKVWNWAGKKRTSEKNIGIPVYKIDEEIQKLIGDYGFWLKEFEILETAVRLHHKFVWIHPFEGGNGRWSRLVSNIIYYKYTKKLIFWPENELQLKKKLSFREKYLEALHEADNGRYKELIKLHKELIS